MEETGYLNNMTESEKKVLEEFRKYVLKTENVPQSICNRWYMLRFCRARKFDLKKIKLMFKNYIAWKAENGLLDSGTVDMARYKDIKTNYCHGYYNTDKLGRPIYIEKVNELKPKEMFKAFTDDELFRYYIQSYDR